MKLFFVTILVLSIFSANAQLFSGIDNDESSFIAIQTQNEIDTIRKFAFKIKLLDSKIIKDNEVIFVIEKPTDFHYYRFKKEKEGWLQNNSTGTIAINSKYSSRTMRNYAISSSFKIYFSKSFLLPVSTATLYLGFGNSIGAIL